MATEETKNTETSVTEENINTDQPVTEENKSTETLTDEESIRTDTTLKEEPNEAKAQKKSKQRKGLKARSNKDEKAVREWQASIDGKALYNPGEAKKHNPYYSALAERFKSVKLYLVVALLLFLIFMVLIFGKEITIENFRYLIKDFNLSSIKNTGHYENIIYESSSSAKFGMYKGELAVARPGNTSIYNMYGSLVFSEQNNFYAPEIVTSEKYCLVYDMGDTSYSYALYNSFSLLKTEKYEYPITNAALSSNGTYAIASSSVEYRGIVNVYDSNFNLVSRISKDKYIMDLSFSPDGKKLMVLSAYDRNGSWVGELMICDPTSDSNVETYVFDGRMPIFSGFIDGGYAVMTDAGLHFTDKNGQTVSEHIFGDLTPIYCRIYNNYVVCAFNKTILGNDKIIRVYGTSGQILYDGTHTGRLIDTDVSDGYLYLLFEDRLVRIDIIAGEVAEKNVDGNGFDVLYEKDGGVLVCYAGVATRIVFNDEDVADTATPDTTAPETEGPETDDETAENGGEKTQ